MEELGLKELIRQTRLEIEAAAQEREDAGEPGLFQVDSVTIEANFIVRKNAGLEGSFKLVAVSLEGGGKLEKEQVQKVTVVLSPVPSSKRGLPLSEPWLMDVGDSIALSPAAMPGGIGTRPAPHDLLMQIPSSGARLWVTPRPGLVGLPRDLGEALGKDDGSED